MRYFVRLGKGTRGPLTVEELQLLPGFGPSRLVCPEGRDVRNRRHWVPARTVPDLAAIPEQRPAAEPRPFLGASGAAEPGRFGAAAVSLEPPARPAASWRPLAALAAVLGLAGAGGVASLFFDRVPGGKGARLGAKPASRLPAEAVKAAIAPACLSAVENAMARASVSSAPDGGQEWVLAADPAARLAEARFAYDPKREILKPLNDEARRLTAPGGCR